MTAERVDLGVEDIVCELKHVKTLAVFNLQFRLA